MLIKMSSNMPSFGGGGKNVLLKPIPESKRKGALNFFVKKGRIDTLNSDEDEKPQKKSRLPELIRKHFFKPKKGLDIGFLIKIVTITNKLEQIQQGLMLGQKYNNMGINLW